MEAGSFFLLAFMKLDFLISKAGVSVHLLALPSNPFRASELSLVVFVIAIP